MGTQRFDIGMSGKWSLVSNHLNVPLRHFKNGKNFVFTSNPKARIKYLRWNARQIITPMGKAINSNVDNPTKDFDFRDKNNWFTPTDCSISKLVASGNDNYLAINNGKVIMSSNI